MAKSDWAAPDEMTKGMTSGKRWKRGVLLVSLGMDLHSPFCPRLFRTGRKEAKSGFILLPQAGSSCR